MNEWRYVVVSVTEPRTRSVRTTWVTDESMLLTLNPWGEPGFPPGCNSHTFWGWLLFTYITFGLDVSIWPHHHHGAFYLFQTPVQLAPNPVSQQGVWRIFLLRSPIYRGNAPLHIRYLQICLQRQSNPGFWEFSRHRPTTVHHVEQTICRIYLIYRRIWGVRQQR